MAHITTELTNNEYRQIPAWSKSDLDLIHKSPALVAWSKSAPQAPSEVGNIGTATHSALLEHDLFISDYVRCPEFNRATKAGREQSESFTSAMTGKEVLSAEDHDLVVAMKDSVLAHPVANRLLTVKGVSEGSIFFEVDGIKCKARADRIPDHEEIGFHCVVDVKTTGSMDKFKFSVRDYRYHCQAAWYSKAYYELTGFYPRFIFVVVSKQKTFGKHEVRVFELTKDDVDQGWSECLEDLEAIKELESFGCGLDIEVLALPKKWG